MTPCILLVHVPGLPMLPQSLLPNAYLAALAGALTQSKQEVRILDFGTLQTLQYLAERTEASPSASDCLPFLKARHQRQQDASLERQVRLLSGHACDQIVGNAPSIAALYAGDGGDLYMARKLAIRLRRVMPALRLVLVGPYAATYGNLILEKLSEFDAVCVTDPVSALLACTRDDIRHLSTPLPHGLLVRGQDSAAVADPAIFQHDPLTLPEYEASVYPAMDQGKFRFFTVEHIRGTGWGAAEHVRHARTVAREVQHLEKACSARVFHFEGENTPPEQVRMLTRELLASEPIYYSRSGHLGHYDIAVLDALVSSGCQAVGFELHTGSQRLLEEFYHAPFGVSKAEELLGRAQTHDLYTVTRLTFPCPREDYHTQAETLRILQRCRPQAAPMDIPILTPDSPWLERAAEFGFSAPHASYATAVTGAKAESAAEASRTVGYRMPGLREREALRLKSQLETGISELGISTTGCERFGCIARMAGYAGLEAAYFDAFAHALSALQIDTISGLMATFNTSAAVASNTVAFRPLVSTRAAVGN